MQASSSVVDYRLLNPKSAHFNPYSSNGGTLLAVAGENFAIVASDSRLSEGFMIHTRDLDKSFKLTNQTVLSCAGFHGDVLTLTSILNTRLKMFEHEHQKVMSTSAVAAMLSTILYYRRFFPYYTYNIIGGLDDEGKGCVYSFDPIGSYQREQYRAAGTAGAILQPLLDNQIGHKNQDDTAAPPLTIERALTLVRDVFISASERDIYTGDSLKIEVITKDGVKVHHFPLRKD